jgi:hypothetical protein
MRKKGDNELARAWQRAAKRKWQQAAHQLQQRREVAVVHQERRERFVRGCGEVCERAMCQSDKLDEAGDVA